MAAGLRHLEVGFFEEALEAFGFRAAQLDGQYRRADVGRFSEPVDCVHDRVAESFRRFERELHGILVEKTGMNVRDDRSYEYTGCLA